MSHNRNRALRRAAETRAAVGLDTLRDRMPITVASIGGQQSLTMALDAEARGYANSAVAYRCVAAIADNGASVPLAVRGPDGEEIGGHPVAHLFNKRPNPLMSARVFKSLLLQQLELAGQAFVWLDRGETGVGDVTEMHLVFDQVDVIVDRPLAQRPTTANVIGFMIRRGDGTQVPVLPEELLWLRYPHPWDPLGCLAPWKAARHAVDMDAFAREWQRSSYANGAGATGVVYLGDMNENEYNQVKAGWRSQMQGPANAGRTLLVRSAPGGGGQGGGKGIGFERLTFTPEEMEYLESRMANAAEVMLAFGVPHDYLAAGTTYENRSAARSTLWSDTIAPKLEVIGSEIDLRMLPSDSEEAAFDLSTVAALQEAQDSVANRTRASVYSDTLMIDEARAELGYDALPGGIGQNTLTPYRALFAPVQGAAGADEARSWDADFSRIPPTAPDVGALVERAVEAALSRLLGGPSPAADAGQTPRRAELTRADDTPSSPPLADITAAYDDLEPGGRRAVQALAREQQTRVLRDFDRLMKRPERSAAWLGEVRTEACALAREDQVRLAPPDPDEVPAARLTDMDVAAGPDGWEQRIKVGEIFDPRYWRRRTGEVLRPWVERVWQRGGTDIVGSFDLDEPTVADALRDRVDELAGQVTATTEQVLRSQLLAHGIAEGESVPELRARIQQVFANLGDYRATMIARTETVGGYSQASFLAALDAGATTKTWLATDDKRTRPTHRSASGSTAAMNKRFPLTKSRWPADPTAPASQSIQCRCALTFQFETEES
ncbi:phage portal protein [Streptomyces sp. DSM 41014]|uniref:Phage portal protein n=1 Tax=Streptomyces hintoniae TaxID=3075521 RepID=A0ABU2UIA5_9ACTN|nr:phage portal protein [Streptomyces sp. DSM 41014]MDT0472998.1 phage portal protein [Streptomyces sp. DSM 41014]